MQIPNHLILKNEYGNSSIMCNKCKNYYRVKKVISFKGQILCSKCRKVCSLTTEDTAINLLRENDRKELKNILWETYIKNQIPVKQIASLFNTTTKVIDLNLRILKIPLRTSKERWDIELKDKRFMRITKRRKQILIGSLFGDGCIIKNSKRSCVYFERHAKEQKGYIEWKAKCFKRNLKTIQYIEKRDKSSQFSGRKGLYTQYELNLNTHPYFKYLRIKFYPKDKKIINEEMLNQMEALGLAVWYLDDGSIRRSGDNYIQITLHHKFNNKKEENFILKYFKDKWGLTPDIRRYKRSCHSIYFNSKNSKSFMSIIKPLVKHIKCMQYKLA